MIIVGKKIEIIFEISKHRTTLMLVVSDLTG